MLISRLALLLFWFPGVCPLRLEYFVFLKRITGSFSCFRCLIFKVLCALLFCQALDYFTTSSRLCQELFPEVFLESFSILSHRFRFVKNFFLSAFRGIFLSYHNQSRFVKIFFRSVERLTILPRFLSLVNTFF